MARNTGTATRTGAVKNRTQTYNEKTGQYIKRDATTGRFMSSKSTAYKGVAKDGKAKSAVKKGGSGKKTKAAKKK